MPYVFTSVRIVPDAATHYKVIVSACRSEGLGAVLVAENGLARVATNGVIMDAAVWHPTT